MMQTAQSAYILTIGSELTSGAQDDSNAHYLARRLAEIGIVCRHMHSASDERGALIHAVLDGLDLADIVLVTGGLGPTDDDITRECVAEAVGRELIMDDEYARVLRERFGVTSAKQLRQATRPEGATFISEATSGTAPGFRYQVNGKCLWVMPGVPTEMKEMFEDAVVPELLLRYAGAPPVSRTYRLSGIGEVEAEERMNALLAGRTGLSVLPKLGEVHLRVTAGAALVDELDTAVPEHFADEYFGTDEETLAGSVGRLLRSRSLTIGTVESCTGGLVAELLTQIPGSSDYFVGAIVSYSDTVKTALTAVPQELLDRFGAVSEEVAVAMAEGGRRALGCDVAISVTGVAGPGGGTAQKPVGLVYVALAWDGGTACERHMFMGSREAVRLRSAKRALNMARLHLTGRDG